MRNEPPHDDRKITRFRRWIIVAATLSALAFVAYQGFVLFNGQVTVEVENKTGSSLLDVQFEFEGAAGPVSFGEVAVGELKRRRVSRTAMKQCRLTYKRADDGRVIRLPIGYTDEQERTLEPAIRFIVINDSSKPGENNVVSAAADSGRWNDC